MNLIFKIAGLCLATSLLVTPMSAKAQSWATKPVRWIVPYPPGSNTDLLVRIVGEQLSKRIGQPVIVENQPGAGGMIGAATVSRAPPDGHTLVLHTPAWPATKVFVKSPTIPVPEGLEPVSLMTEGRLALVISNGVPATNFKDFITYAKANPDKLNYATTGPGDILLGLETIKAVHGIKATLVNYRGAAQTTPAIVANEVQYAIQPETSSTNLARDAKLRIIAVTGEKRTELNPDVPTFAELGHPDIRNNWFAVFVAPGTPADLVERISRDIVAIVQMPELKQRLKDISLTPIGSSPAELRQHIATTIREYEATAKAANIKPE